MQSNLATVRQTYDRPVASRTPRKLEKNHNSIDDVVYWLERNDEMVEQLVGYGICGITLLYLAASMIRVLLS